MNRRSFLRSLGAGAALTGAGAAGAHPTVTDPATPPEESAPDPLGTLEIEAAREAVVAGDGTVYVAANDGFLAVDAADPAEPTVLAERRGIPRDSDAGQMRDVYDLSVAGDRLLVVGPANPGHDGFHGALLYDVSDPTAPERVAAHETGHPIHNASLVDGLAYLAGTATEGNPLVILDAESGDEVGRWSLLDRDDAWREVAVPLRVLHDVTVRGDRAYLAHWDAGTWILDVSDPEAPEVVSRVRGRDPETLADLDVDEATRLPGNDHRAAVGPDGDLLAINAEAWAVDEDDGRGPGGIEFYDVSDPGEPVRLSGIPAPPTPDPTRGGVWTTSHNFELTDERCYASWYQGGVSVHDVREPTNPAELYHWRDAGRARFWTAQRLSAGEAFLGSSMGVPGEDGAPGGLFTFPDPDAPGDSRESAAAPSTDGGPSGAMGQSTGGESTDGTGEARTLGLLGLGAAAVGAWTRLR
ncbi:LVIVD repeat-containing protein [Halomicrobium salinisoli]|uniref:LVIVD repeat-containing protein n=1 Tax=Halomicrobium salinisoli TaxID=2878391 RepID=UPI001CF0104E|nr:hypothetical protein [Halomicrobium salinisoli]